MKCCYLKLAVLKVSLFGLLFAYGCNDNSFQGSKSASKTSNGEEMQTDGLAKEQEKLKETIRIESNEVGEFDVSKYISEKIIDMKISSTTINKIENLVLEDGILKWKPTSEDSGRSKTVELLVETENGPRLVEVTFEVAQKETLPVVEEEFDPAKILEEKIADGYQKLLEKCNGNSVQAFAEVINFPEAGEGCWGQSGNYRSEIVSDPKSGYSAALAEQHKELNIPNNALLCEIEVEFQNGGNQQKIYYDDDAYIVFNNLLLTATNNVHLAELVASKRLQKNSGFISWETSAILGTTFDNTTPGYCVEGNNICEWPETQTEGTLQLVLSKETIMKAVVVSRELNQGEVMKPKFSMITTGDNDINNDCRHSNLNMSIKGSYVVP